MLINDGCKKNDANIKKTSFNSQQVASVVANRVEHLAYNPMLIEPDGFSTYRNPLEDYGFAVKRLCEQLVKLNTTDSDSLRMIAESTDYVRYRSLSLEGVNQEVVKQILRVLPDLHVNVALDVFLKRIQLMEYEVFRSDDVLSLKDRNFILGYVSLLRNAYETIARQESDQGWGDRWESCMRRKFRSDGRHREFCRDDAMFS